MELTALTLPQDQDLRPLSGALWNQGVRHRIFEENGMQVVVVGTPEEKDYVCELYARWQRGEVSIQRVEGGEDEPPPSMVADRARRVPMTLVLLALAFAGFLVPYLGMAELLAKLTFTDFAIVQGGLEFRSNPGEFWRLLTPIFLHFGWLHIAFNSLWLWEFGGRIEQRLGSFFLLFLVVIVGVGSNIAQFMYTGPSLFGGMSGVVYGLLGFCWIVGERMREPLLTLPRGIVLFMLGWLVFCMVGPTELMGAGSVANAAHAGGLVLGCLMGGVFLLLRPRLST